MTSFVKYYATYCNNCIKEKVITTHLIKMQSLEISKCDYCGKTVEEEIYDTKNQNS